MTLPVHHRYALWVALAESAAAAAVAVLLQLHVDDSSLATQVIVLVGAVVGAAAVYVTAVSIVFRRAGRLRGPLELLAIAPHSIVACLTTVGVVHPRTFLVSSLIVPIAVWWRARFWTVEAQRAR